MFYRSKVIVILLLFVSWLTTLNGTGDESPGLSFIQTQNSTTGIVRQVFAWSPDGMKIAIMNPATQCNPTVENDHDVKIIDAATGQLVRTLAGHRCLLDSIAWSPDGNYVIGTADLETTYVWNPSSGNVITTMPPSSSRSFVWNPVDNRLAFGSGNDIVIMDSGLNTITLMMIGHIEPVSSVAWSPDGTKIVSGSGDTTVRIWNASTGQLLQTLQGHTATVSAVAWSMDGAKILSASTDDTFRIWNVSNGQLLQTLQTGSEGILSIALHPSGTIFATSGVNGIIGFWSLETGQLINTLQSETRVLTVAWSPDGSKFAYDKGETGIEIIPDPTTLEQTDPYHENGDLPR